MARKKPASKKKAPPKRVGHGRAAKVDHWNVTRLMTSPQSRLVEADLVNLFSNRETWAHFTKDELEKIGLCFPEHVPRNEDGAIQTDWLRYDNDWRHAIRQWQEDLRLGFLSPEWQQKATAASLERAAGRFDKFKQDEFEEFWGQKQKLDIKMLAGASAALKIADLIAGKIFKEGDFWVYSKVWPLGTERIEVVKDCKIVGIGDKALTFAIPPGILRHAKIIPQTTQEGEGQELAAKPAQEDVVIFTADNVRALEDKILELDGRVINTHHHNAWKCIRCQRNNQDLGSLFEVREEYYVFKHPH